jgi:dipeptidyl aminopeptidase/acylaminoacyl peptidase
MVFQQTVTQAEDIWRAPALRSPHRGQPPERLIASTTPDQNPDYSPDGRRIVFGSGRGGSYNLWICDSDGTNPVQLTSFEEGRTGSARWSPDGRRIAFDRTEAGDADVWLIDADGGAPRRLTRHPSTDVTGTWARDGRSIYFRSHRSGTAQIWRLPAEGGEAVQVTTNGGWYALESWDGRHVYYTKSSQEPRAPALGLWRMPVGGGPEEEVLEKSTRFWFWALGRSGVYLTASEATPGWNQEYTIRHFDLRSGQMSELLRREGPFWHLWLAVSPGEDWILFSEGPLEQSELMLMENFR